MYKARAATVMPVASQTFLKIQIAIAYKTIAATTCIKSPLEKEKSIINVKQHTMAGPRSPNTKNNKIVVTIAITANTKNDNLLLNEGYSEINFSLVAKKPARKKMTRYFTISLGWNPKRFTLTPLPSGPVPNKMVRNNKPIAASAHGQPLAAFLSFLKMNRRKKPESGVNFFRLINWSTNIAANPYTEINKRAFRQEAVA